MFFLSSSQLIKNFSGPNTSRRFDDSSDSFVLPCYCLCWRPVNILDKEEYILEDRRSTISENILAWLSTRCNAINTFRLYTNTYGTGAKFFCNQLFPNTSNMILNYFYVVGLLSGCSTQDKTSLRHKELSHIFSSNDFNVHKIRRKDLTHNNFSKKIQHPKLIWGK